MCSVSGRSGSDRARVRGTDGYIALGDWLRVVEAERDVGVSPADVGVFCFRALWLGRARTTVGPSATLRSVIGCALWTQGGMWASVLLTWARSGSERPVWPRAYDGRTVGYIALGDGLRVVDTGRDVGVSSADVGAIWFRAPCLAARVRR